MDQGFSLRGSIIIELRLLPLLLVPNSKWGEGNHVESLPDSGEGSG